MDKTTHATRKASVIQGEHKHDLVVFVDRRLRSRQNYEFIVAALAWWQSQNPTFEPDWETLAASDYGCDSPAGYPVVQIVSGDPPAVELISRGYEDHEYLVYSDLDCEDIAGKVELK